MDLATVRKLSYNKLPVFEDFIKQHSELLKKNNNIL